MSIETSEQGADPARHTRAGRRSIVSAAVTDRQTESARVADARSQAEQRLRRQRGTLRPLGLAIIVVVVDGSAGNHPAPALHGQGARRSRWRWPCSSRRWRSRSGICSRVFRWRSRLAVIAAMGAAGVALAALQPKAATELAAGAAVWMAVARLPLALGASRSAARSPPHSTSRARCPEAPRPAVLATVLLCALLGLVAYFIRQARGSQDQDRGAAGPARGRARGADAAAAIAERGRIASELHDVLAHSLSGAAIQLQGARMLAERAAGEAARPGGDRPRERARQGRPRRTPAHAVGALRGDELPGVAQLESLVDSFRTDMNVDVDAARSRATRGRSRPTPASRSTAAPRRR